MNAAPCSWRGGTGRIEMWSTRGSRMSIVSSPGTEKTYSQPSATRQSTRRWAAVRPDRSRVTRPSLGFESRPATRWRVTRLRPCAGRRPASSLRRGEDHDPELRHVLDRPAQPLATEPGVLDAAVRHVVDPVRRHVVDDDAADLERAERLPGVVEVVREDAGLEPEEAVVDGANRLVEVGERERDDERSEGLVRADLRLDGHVGEDGRSAEVAVSPTTEEDLAAERDRLLDPALRPRGCLVVDHRPDVGVRIERIANREALRTLHQATEELVPDRFVDEHPLDADADLTGV